MANCYFVHCIITSRTIIEQYWNWLGSLRWCPVRAIWVRFAIKIIQVWPHWNYLKMHDMEVQWYMLLECMFFVSHAHFLQILCCLQVHISHTPVMCWHNVQKFIFTWLHESQIAAAGLQKCYPCRMPANWMNTIAQSMWIINFTLLKATPTHAGVWKPTSSHTYRTTDIPISHRAYV